MSYPSIRIEGAILSPDILGRLEDLPGQRPADFGFDSAVKVKDEIARAWADAQDYWRIFQRRLEASRPDSPATTETRQQWVLPLLGLLGYQLEYQAKGVELHGKNYAISHRVINRGNTPVHIVGAREPAGLDRKPEKAGLRMSAHAMVQEYINLHEELYAIVTNGRILRMLRDSSRLVKLTYLEFDLDRIFADGLFADFAILYRLLHVTRLPASIEAAAECLLERYHQDSLDSGARIRSGLSRAVEEAIRNFGNGFLSHPANGALRERVTSGDLTAAQYYQDLLHLIYRLLFLMVIEERDLVFPLSADRAQREIYTRHYSLQRLRRLSEKRYLADRRKHDLWLSLRATFQLFEAHGPGQKLGIAPLAGDLFSWEAVSSLARCTLGNDVLLQCIQSLSLYRHPDNRQIIRVNYAALNVEEFGSVYEGLLEYQPVFITADGRTEFAFAEGDERAATGSHYTPDDLVQPLIKHSLDYLIADKLKQPEPEKALLSLRVADISCGSGHILLAAARRIATELAILRTGEEQPAPTALRAATRDVIRECIYGVDLNPLAVELCKVALWLEAHVPGEPLNFLDHHIKCGNAIVGFVRREDVERGVPDEAFAAMPGDDKGVAASYRKRNKTERAVRAQLQTTNSQEVEGQLHMMLQRWREISSLPEHTPDEIAAKKQRYLDFAKGPDAWGLAQLASMPIAQFYLPKTEENREKFITDAEFRQYWSGERAPQGQAPAAATATGFRKGFFHWFLEFPEIIEGGGFDCVLGNPPYLGGQALSGTYRYAFCHYVKWEYAPAGLSELVVFFLRRIFALLKTRGSLAIITTNSIKDGDVRADGLESVLACGGRINFAVRGIKWPGRANLVVSLVAVQKSARPDKCVLDGREVKAISSHLEEGVDVGPPRLLNDNARRIFQGSIFLGDGFLLSVVDATAMKARCRDAEDVIFPVLNGEEINNVPNQEPQRQIINFFDWPLEKAARYDEPFRRIECLVKPERLANRRVAHLPWWQYERLRADIYNSIKCLNHCYVAAATTKFLNFSRVNTDYIFLNTLYVLTTDRWDLYTVVQSTLHEIWARKYSGSLETRLRYSPSDCLETFPFSDDLWQAANPTLASVGEHYHDHRRNQMLSLWLGLTDIYNLFHLRDLTVADVARVSKKPADIAAQGYEGILELRRLHRELDNAVRDAYGWQDLDLGHDFHEVETLPENDRVRYTISPAARKELLKRLLQLNHERAAAEAAATPAKKKRGKKTPKAEEVEKNLDLFPEEVG